MVETDYFVHPSAYIDFPSEIGRGTKIWHFSHVMAGCRIGPDCKLGQNVFVGDGVIIGARTKIQNNVSIYSGVELGEDVFCGPSCVFTNVRNPRAQLDRGGRYDKTVVQRGVTIGANATILCGITIGQHAFIGAAAFISRDVDDYALMVGVPAVQKGWVGRHGRRLVEGKGQLLICPETGWRYRKDGSGSIRCLDWPEDKPLDA